jgi:hypothetical protein
MAVFATGLLEARIVAKKADHFAAPGTYVSHECLEISPCERRYPSPVATEDVA